MVTAICGVNFNKPFYLLSVREGTLKSLKVGLQSNYPYVKAPPQILYLPNISPSELCITLNIRNDIWYQSSISLLNRLEKTISRN